MKWGWEANPFADPHVAPCAGAGIEIHYQYRNIPHLPVAPCAGAGIEMKLLSSSIM